MGYTCGLLLLILLPFSTGAEWSDLLKGLDFDKNLSKIGAVGLKQYALHFSNAVDYIKREAIDQYLDNNEKAALGELSSGLIQVQKVLVKAVRGVTVIKERSNALLLLLSAIKTEQEKLEMAMHAQLFSMEWDAEKKEFEDGLLQANRTLQNSQMMLRSIVQELHLLEEDIKADEDAAENDYYGVWVEVIVNMLYGTRLWMPASTVSEKQKNYFWKQRCKINDRIADYKTISMKTDVVCEGVGTKLKQVQDVYAKLTTTGYVAGEQFHNPQVNCELIQQLAEGLVKACDTFLEG